MTAGDTRLLVWNTSGLSSFVSLFKYAAIGELCTSLGVHLPEITSLDISGDGTLVATGVSMVKLRLNCLR